MAEEKKTAERPLSSELEQELEREIETDERIRDLADILGDRVTQIEQTEPKEERDPEAILRDPRFAAGRETFSDRVAAWDGKNALVSLIAAALSLLLLAGSFVRTLMTHGQVGSAFGAVPVIGALAALYAVVFGAVSVHRKERRMKAGIAGFASGVVFFAAYAAVFAAGV